MTGPGLFPNINPANGKLLAQVSEASEDMVGQAVLSARVALRGEWGQMPVDQRCDMLHRPVCHIAPFEREDEAIAMANDSNYGLAAAVWTTNLQRGHRVAGKIEAGIVWVNTWYLRDLRTPFGGVKLSGIGREGGRHSLNFYSEPTNICIKL